MTINLWKTTYYASRRNSGGCLTDALVSTRELNSDDVAILVQERYKSEGVTLYDYVSTICIGIGNHGELLWGEAEG